MKKLYYNGDFITMDNTEITALIEENGKIIETGSINNLWSKADQRVNLENHTILPAFIDAHSHFMAYANSLLQINLAEASSVNDILDKITDFIKINKPKKDSIIKAANLNDMQLKEKRMPTKKELDQIAKDYLVILSHQSSHGGVFNSKALEFLNINSETKPCDGGYIDFENGILKENDYVNSIKKIPMDSMEDYMKAFKKTQEVYLKNGITTIQEGFLQDVMTDFYDTMIKENFLKIDLVGYVDPNSQKFIDKFKDHFNKYKDQFKIGGYKVFLDGSPQLKTAWVELPYTDGSHGISTMSDKAVLSAIKKAKQDNIQILAHCNGDKAATQYMEQYSKVYDENNIRPVIVHAQFSRPDQLDKVKELKMIPSFFPSHVYYWGDTHIENIGYERASHISCSKSALERDILFTFHNDSPVIEPNLLETIWCATNRLTKENVHLGAEEIDVYSALKAITINAAYQYSEENIKGSLTVGKNADFVILDQNPLKIDKSKIKDIKILKTIKNGKILYSL